eukprot:Tbor_TRINITY_DN6116_c0_g1::TRINITY_DN6116_c0_g1_i6::g.22538::m.22538
MGIYIMSQETLPSAITGSDIKGVTIGDRIVSGGLAEIINKQHSSPSALPAGMETNILYQYPIIRLPLINYKRRQSNSQGPSNIDFSQSPVVYYRQLQGCHGSSVTTVSYPQSKPTGNAQLILP